MERRSTDTIKNNSQIEKQYNVRMIRKTLIIVIIKDSKEINLWDSF